MADFYDFVQHRPDGALPDRGDRGAVSGARSTRNICLLIPWNDVDRGSEGESGVEEKISYSIEERIL